MQSWWVGRFFVRFSGIFDCCYCFNSMDVIADCTDICWYLCLCMFFVSADGTHVSHT